MFNFGYKKNLDTAGAGSGGDNRTLMTMPKKKFRLVSTSKDSHEKAQARRPTSVNMMLP